MTRKQEGPGFIAGWFGGALSVATTHPLDTIKVRLQLFTQYKGVTDCIRKIVRDEGLRSFYRGMAFPLFTFSVYNSVIFGSYQFLQNEICRWRYNDLKAHPSLTDQFVAAMATGACSVLIGAPVDLIKIRLQMQTESLKGKIPKMKGTSSTMTKLSNRPPHAEYHRIELAKEMHLSSQRNHYSGPIACARYIYRQNGIRGLYRGAGVMLIRDIPGYAFYLVPYFSMRNYLTKDEDEKNVLRVLIASALAGGCAGVLSWGGIHVIDTVKTRIQADAQNSDQKYKGIVQCVKSIYQENGISAFFRGITLNALRGFPQSAFLFFGVEVAHQLLNQLNEITEHTQTTTHR